MKNEETAKIEKLEQLIQTKAFLELSDAEKEFVLEEFELEERYQAMRKLTPILNEMTLDQEEVKPRPSTLESLKQSLGAEDSTNSVWNKLFAWRVPAYAAVLVVGISCAVTWWLTDQPVIEITEKPLVVNADTVYVTSKPDTIFKEKVVYRFVKMVEKTKTPMQLPDNLTSDKNAVPVGVSMKDKEELEKLLVSGSR